MILFDVVISMCGDDSSPRGTAAGGRLGASSLAKSRQGAIRRSEARRGEARRGTAPW